MGKKVAVVGEAKEEAGSKLPTGADSGTWSPAPGGITYTSYDKLKVGGKKVIWKASCGFNFVGKAGNSNFNTSETVTLEAKPKKTNKSQHAVLVDGDSITSSKGANKITISAAGKLTTS
jgi:hypothetical protein